MIKTSLFLVLLVIMVGTIEMAVAQPAPPQNDVAVYAIPNQWTCKPGDSLNFTIVVKNNGTVPDIIVVDSLIVPAGWTAELRDNGTLVSIPYYIPSQTNTLQPNETHNLTLILNVPLNASGVSIIINVHSYANPTKTANTTIKVRVSTPPKIVSFSPPQLQISDRSPATRTFSISTDQVVNVSWYFNNLLEKTDTNTTSSTFTKTAKVGTYNVTVVVKNENGSTTLTWTWKVSRPPPSTGGYAGGGGGGYTVPLISFKAKPEVRYEIAVTVPANTERKLEMPERIREAGILSIVIKPSERAAPWIGVSKVKELPPEVPEVENAYGYYEIIVKTKAKIEAKIDFRVPKDWMEKNGFSPEDIVFMKYNQSWKELRTEKTGEDDEYYYYRAEVESFSIFAIAAKPKLVVTPAPTPTATAAPETPAPTSTPVLTATTPTVTPLGPPTVIIGAIAAIIAVIAVIVYLAKRR